MYFISVWGTCALSTFDKLEKLHIKAAKLVYKLPTETNDFEVLRRAQWKPVKLYL